MEEGSSELLVKRKKTKNGRVKSWGKTRALLAPRSSRGHFFSRGFLSRQAPVQSISTFGNVLLRRRKQTIIQSEREFGVTRLISIFFLIALQHSSCSSFS